MPVNTAALKTFAPAMRRQLLEAVGRKLDLLLHSQTPDTLSTYSKQIAQLREQEAENRDQLLERVAYTWFNRLCALRYLDARSWHPFGCKVLMPAAEGETQPELLKLTRAGSLPTELKAHTNEARLHGLLDGQIPPAVAVADPQGEVYRELVLTSCRSYHQLLPELFEGLDDASELLLPDDLLSEGSIAGGFRSAISDDDCQDVEIIGWLYQFYISEKKDQVIGKVVKSEDIPAATQLFTPNWIVKYMVQNSLGATWLATYPGSTLKGEMEFYIEPAEQTEEVNAQLADITPESLDPEELTLIDPACGSGHILVEAYDLLKAIYLERGYQQRDIPELILTKNLYGLDICPRAAQLSTFSLLMKGREDDRRLLERGIQLNVMALQNSTGFNVERLAASVDLAAAEVSLADVRILAELFAHATTFGSLIQVPSLVSEKLPLLSRLAEQSCPDLFSAGDLRLLGALAKQATILEKKYDSVVANPPYMGSKYHQPKLKEYLKREYPGFEKDLFSSFVVRCTKIGKRHANIGIMSPNVWLYISSHEELRKAVSTACSLTSLVELPLCGFEGATVQICSFILLNEHLNSAKGSFVRLVDIKGEPNDFAQFAIEAIQGTKPWLYRSTQDDFGKIPGRPLAYWLPPAFVRSFSTRSNLGELARASKGLVTGDNASFVREWWEPCFGSIGLGCTSREEANSSRKKWFPYAKGGRFRRWSGNLDAIVNWESDGLLIQTTLTDDKSRVRATNLNLDRIFIQGISWTVVTSGSPSFRLVPSGHLYADAAGILQPKKGSVDTLCLLSYLNSSPVRILLGALNPTLNLQPGNLESLPGLGDVDIDKCREIASAACKESERDWNSYERSMFFRCSPLLKFSSSNSKSIDVSCREWLAENHQAAMRLKQLEEENNCLFEQSFGLGESLKMPVHFHEVSLIGNLAYKYGSQLSDCESLARFFRDTVAEFVSYATGCMMGRYSLDQPGLILADSRDSQASQLASYEANVGKPLSEVQFKPDPDGIITVLDGEWFEDDIVARTREFLEVTFPESTVTENLHFIEESLGKDIRKYFCNDFYKDHLQTYKKRPIYWMVQSPKKGFACLIYLHRYTKDTLNQVLNNYFRPYLQKLEARLAQLGLDQLNDSLPTRERTAARKEAEKITKVLKECQAWEQDALLPLAQQRIELDLDDGVKVNYLKLQDVLAPIPGLAAKED
jgi:hypothetical protein